jgi:hypothetical protein
MPAPDGVISYRKTNCYGHPTQKLSEIVNTVTLMGDEFLLSTWTWFLSFLSSVLFLFWF